MVTTSGSMANGEVARGQLVVEPLLLPGDPGYGDLSARAKLRNVALAQIAASGIEATTVRGVAREAGVSPSLLQHHFATKDGLRAACDRYVVDYLRRVVSRLIDQGGLAEGSVLVELYQTAAPITQYLARALVDDSPAAAALFDDVVGLIEQVLRGAPPSAAARSEPDEVRQVAAVYASMKLGVVVLHRQLSRVLGIDVLTPVGLNQIRSVILDVLAGDLAGGGSRVPFVEDLVDKARRGTASNDATEPPEEEL